MDEENDNFFLIVKTNSFKLFLNFADMVNEMTPTRIKNGGGSASTPKGFSYFCYQITNLS